MDLERLTCGGCGAALEVPEGVAFVNCRHCGASLKVQRTDSVAFTEVLQVLKEHSDRIAENTEALSLQNQLAQLDREWDQRSATLMIYEKNGQPSVPSKEHAVFSGILLIAVGIFLTVIDASPGAPLSPLPPIGLITIAGGIAMGLWLFAKANKYQQFHNAYDQERSELVARLRTLGFPAR